MSDLKGRSKGRTGNGRPGREQQQWAARRLGRRPGRRRRGKAGKEIPFLGAGELPGEEGEKGWREE